MYIGILAGLTTCALWGLTFIAPRAVHPFSTWDLTIGRYATFGLASLLLMLHPRFRPSGLTARPLCTGLLLGAAGYVGYFVCAAYAVRLAGAAIPPLVIGTMPVLLAVIANARDRSVPRRQLALPLTLIVIGVAVVNITVIGSVGAAQRGNILLGLLCAVGALVIWVLYGLVNAAALQRPDPPDALHWTGLQGVGAALGSLLLLPLASFGQLDALRLSDSFRFLSWALVLGLIGSWFATWCWVIASRRLPLALCAQLIVVETVFGLAYGFLFEERWPGLAEWLGALLQLAGVCTAISAFATRQRMHRSEP